MNKEKYRIVRIKEPNYFSFIKDLEKFDTFIIQKKKLGFWFSAKYKTLFHRSGYNWHISYLKIKHNSLESAEQALKELINPFIEEYKGYKIQHLYIYNLTKNYLEVNKIYVSKGKLRDLKVGNTNTYERWKNEPLFVNTIFSDITLGEVKFQIDAHRSKTQ